MTEDNSALVSGEERERADEIFERTNRRISRDEALRRVIGSQRMVRLAAAKKATLEVDQHLPSVPEPTLDERAEADEAGAFAGQMANEGIFDINVFLARHPDAGTRADAIRLGFLDPEE